MKKKRKSRAKKPSFVTLVRRKDAQMKRTAVKRKEGWLKWAGVQGKKKRRVIKRVLKRNPVKGAHCYAVVEMLTTSNPKSNSRRMFKYASFPLTPVGKKNAMDYARALHRAHSKKTIAVIKQ